MKLRATPDFRISAGCTRTIKLDVLVPLITSSGHTLWSLATASLATMNILKTGASMDPIKSAPTTLSIVHMIVRFTTVHSLPY